MKNWYHNALRIILFLVLGGMECLAQIQHTPIPKDVPAHWKTIIGEYCSQADTLVLLERGERLWLVWTSGVTEEVVNRGNGYVLPATAWKDTIDTLMFSPIGLNAWRTLTVRGKTFSQTLSLASPVQSEMITPVRPISELRKQALTSSPPVERGNFLSDDLVEVSLRDSSIMLDIRYASTNNFMGTPFYSQAKAFLQRPAAEALVRVHQGLQSFGLGLVVFDGYRPWYVTKMFWEATPAEKKEFVADPARGSRHNRGCAVDVSLYDLDTKHPVQMVSGYDEFTHRAYPAYEGGTSRQRWYRDLLHLAMEREGFTRYEWEWWHYDYRDWKQYPIGTKTFEELQ